MHGLKFSDCSELRYCIIVKRIKILFQQLYSDAVCVLVIVAQVYMDDSLGERIWVDRPDCKVFVENIQAAFGTKLPKISMVATEGAGKSETPGIIWTS